MSVYYRVSAFRRTQPVPVAVSHTAAVWRGADGVAITVLNTARLGRTEEKQRERQRKDWEWSERHAHDRFEYWDSSC